MGCEKWSTIDILTIEMQIDLCDMEGFSKDSTLGNESEISRKEGEK